MQTNKPASLPASQEPRNENLPPINRMVGHSAGADGTGDAQGSEGMNNPSTPVVPVEPTTRWNCPMCGEEYAVGVACDLCSTTDAALTPVPVVAAPNDVPGYLKCAEGRSGDDNNLFSKTSIWNECTRHLPENGIEVETKIDDEYGVRNVQTLKRQGNLWFYPDMSMYVYYRPTHWRPTR